MGEKTNTTTDGPAQDPKATGGSAPPEMKPCPICGEPRPVGSAVCPHCGLK